MPAVDLLRHLAQAEKRPAGAFEVAVRSQNGASMPALVAPVPSRVTWSLPLPRDASFRAALAVEGAVPSTSARFRVGISDHRTYEGLAEWVVRAADDEWKQVAVDLTAYAGFQWSLFYRPDDIVWRLVLAVDALEDVPALAFWGDPTIVTDRRHVREYVARRQALR